MPTAGLTRHILNQILNTGGDLVDAYSAESPDPNDQRFITRSLAANMPVGDIEAKRGLFGRGLQGLGLLPDRVQATPDQMAEEQLALRDEQSKGLDAIYKEAQIAKDVGHNNFSRMMEAYTQGLPVPTDLEPFPSELKSRKGRMVLERPVSGTGGEKFVDVDTQPSPDPGMTFQPNKKPSQTPEEAEKLSAARAKGTLTGKTDFMETAPLDKYEAVAKTGFWDPNKLTKIGPKQAKNAPDARAKGFLPVSAKDEAAMRQTKTALDKLYELRSVIANPDTSPFVDDKGMSPMAYNTARVMNAAKISGVHLPKILGGGTLYAGKISTDPQTAKLANEIIAQIKILYDTQKRYASGKELEMTSAILPNVATDNRATALSKLDDLINGYRTSIMAGVEKSSSAEADSEVDDFLSKAFAPEPGAAATDGADSRGPFILPEPKAADEEGADDAD